MVRLGHLTLHAMKRGDCSVSSLGVSILMPNFSQGRGSQLRSIDTLNASALRSGQTRFAALNTTFATIPRHCASYALTKSTDVKSRRCLGRSRLHPVPLLATDCAQRSLRFSLGQSKRALLRRTQSQGQARLTKATAANVSLRMMNCASYGEALAMVALQTLCACFCLQANAGTRLAGFNGARWTLLVS